MPPTFNAVDPTHTAVLRTKAVSSMRRRLRELKRSIIALLVADDALGSSELIPFTLNQEVGRWRFLSDQGKLEAWNVWFQEQVNAGLIQTTAVGSSWMDPFILEAYTKATRRAFRSVSSSVDPLLRREGQNIFERAQFRVGTSTEAAKLLYIRAYDGLQGISADMSAKLSRVMAGAIAHGSDIKETVNRINKEIDGIGKKRALVLARTELIHAYAEGTLDSFERLGVERVNIEVELLTAGDDRVCPECESIAASGPFTIAEARGVIPVHPNCRCAWVPVSIKKKKNFVLA